MILSVIGLIALAVVLMTPDGDGLLDGRREMTVDDLVSKEMKPKPFNGTWLPSGIKKIKNQSTFNLTQKVT